MDESLRLFTLGPADGDDPMLHLLNWGPHLGTPATPVIFHHSRAIVDPALRVGADQLSGLVAPRLILGIPIRATFADFYYML